MLEHDHFHIKRLVGCLPRALQASVAGTACALMKSFLQANVWTEYISDEATVEYMLLPRLAALAETVWSPPQLRDWGSFLHRLKEQLPHLDARNLTYRPLGM